MIQLSDISKKFGETQAARGISLMIPDGSVFGLLGSNGAGKSTLLRMMAGILKEDAGEILSVRCPVLLFECHAADNERILSESISAV